MRTTLMRGVALVSVARAVACASPNQPTPAPTPTAASPTPSGGSRIFSSATSWPYPSRYVLNDDGTLTLEYVGGPSYTGRYQTTGTLVTFAWAGWSVAGPWGATGTLAADTMTVHYNMIMQLTDFEDAVYIRTP